MKRLSLGLLVGVAMLAIPSGASAAITIGETGVPNRACNPDDNFAQAETAGPPGYAVPAGFGVITSWSIRASGAGKLIAWRPTAAPDQFIVVGKSGAESYDPDAVRTFPTRIPVQPNDVLGLRQTGDGQCLFETGVDGDTVRFNGTASDPPDGSTQTLDTEITLERLLVAASLEPDCDNDGFGDESQDSNVPCGKTCKGKPVTIVGTEGNDDLEGTSERDVISGLGGKDEISGLGGKDLICGGKGKDTLRGGKGKDKLYGQKGKDKLRGGGAKDLCVGGKKDDSAKKCEVEKSI